MKDFSPLILNQPDPDPGKPKAGETWMIRTGGVFLDKVKVLKVGWFSVQVEFEDGRKKKVGKIDLVRKV